MTAYKNPFHSEKYQGSTAIIETDVKPAQYKGYLIYHRIKTNTPGGNVFDIVNDGVCVGMRAGINGAKTRIDELSGIPPRAEERPGLPAREKEAG